ncbi:hypothetical protein B0T17DRAFT_617048 [Bombardia bombarda]|uniref:GPI anchored protein n=1 Tax=Bombardia bombarda TaxID=252184 RepID=A0AA40C4X3_9PEZI|nr:hypothetical protein B0T17DRAFT_617048 [Bombardia bombarda]
MRTAVCMSLLMGLLPAAALAQAISSETAAADTKPSNCKLDVDNNSVCDDRVLSSTQGNSGRVVSLSLSYSTATASPTASVHDSDHGHDDHDHDHDHDHSIAEISPAPISHSRSLKPSPTASYGCEAHGDHWHCDGAVSASPSITLVSSTTVVSATVTASFRQGTPVIDEASSVNKTETDSTTTTASSGAGRREAAGLGLAGLGVLAAMAAM